MVIFAPSPPPPSQKLRAKENVCKEIWNKKKMNLIALKFRLLICSLIYGRSMAKSLAYVCFVIRLQLYRPFHMFISLEKSAVLEAVLSGSRQMALSLYRAQLEHYRKRREEIFHNNSNNKMYVPKCSCALNINKCIYNKVLL
jgi:hypothetical protein